MKTTMFQIFIAVRGKTCCRKNLNQEQQENE